MGFKDARSEVIEKLMSGEIQHEIRDQIDVKNVLSTGEKTPEDVIELLKFCKGTQYEAIEHKDDDTIVVHIFKPVVKKVEWYIKCYFIDPDVWFISVHISEK